MRAARDFKAAMRASIAALADTGSTPVSAAEARTGPRGVNAGYCDASSSGVIVRSSAGNWVQAPKRVKAVAKAVEENARFMQHGVHQQGAFLQVSW